MKIAPGAASTTSPASCILASCPPGKPPPPAWPGPSGFPLTAEVMGYCFEGYKEARTSVGLVPKPSLSLLSLSLCLSLSRLSSDRRPLSRVQSPMRGHASGDQTLWVTNKTVLAAQEISWLSGVGKAGSHFLFSLARCARWDVVMVAARASPACLHGPKTLEPPETACYAS